MKTTTSKLLKVALGLIAIALLLFGVKTYYSDTKIVASAASMIDVVDPSVRGSSSSDAANANPYEKGLNAFFVKKDYKSAIEHFLKSDSPAAKYFLGVSLLQSGEYKKADIVLSQVMELGDDFPHHLATYEDVQWFLILSRLGNGGYESTHDAIVDVKDFLRNPSVKYRPHAEKLKEKLESPLYAFTKVF